MTGRAGPGVTARLLAGLGLAGCLGLASGCAAIVRVGVGTDEAPEGGSVTPGLSADGRFIAFTSFARNLRRTS